MWEAYLNFTLLGINLLGWVVLFRKLNKPFRILGLVLLFTLCAELYAFYLMEKGMNNLFIFHILVPLQYIFYSLVFYFELHSTTVKKAIVASIFLIIVSSVFLALRSQKIYEYNSYITIYRHFFLAVWILIFFRQMFLAVEISNPLREPMFWISTGLLFYSMGHFFIEGCMNLLIQKSLLLARKIYFVSVLLGLFMYLLFIIGFFSFTMAPKKK
jgi:hypothetical protein